MVTDRGDPFGGYYAEILRAEGLNEFAVTDTASLTAGDAGRAIRSCCSRRRALTDAQAALLTHWVHGRRQPHRDAARRAARRAARPRRRRRRRSTDGYLKVDTGAGRRAPASPPQTMQFHGTADRYVGRRRHAWWRRCTPTPTRRPPPPPSPCAASAPPAGRPPRSPTTSRARSSTRARATRPGPARSATASPRRSAPTTCSSAPPAMPAGLGHRARSRSRRPTSSSACWPTSSRR